MNRQKIRLHSACAFVGNCVNLIQREKRTIWQLTKKKNEKKAMEKQISKRFMIQNFVCVCECALFVFDGYHFYPVHYSICMYLWLKEFLDASSRILLLLVTDSKLANVNNCQSGERTLILQSRNGKQVDGRKMKEFFLALFCRKNTKNLKPTSSAFDWELCKTHTCIRINEINVHFHYSNLLQIFITSIFLSQF